MSEEKKAPRVSIKFEGEDPGESEEKFLGRMYQQYPDIKKKLKDVYALNIDDDGNVYKIEID